MSKVDYRQKDQMVVAYISLNSHVKVKQKNINATEQQNKGEID